jgi:hypothetical protein
VAGVAVPGAPLVAVTGPACHGLMRLRRARCRPSGRGRREDALRPRERRPFITGVSDDAEVIITSPAAVQCVAVLFMMGAPPRADDEAIIWTTWGCGAF